MDRTISAAELFDHARGLLSRPGRQIMAIAGAPGSGKSTLAETMAATLDRDQPGCVAVLAMDGFHYDDAVLDTMGRRPWKGAPDTFDTAGLRSLLMRLRDPREGAVAAPVFDRDLEISRGSARIIPASAQLILLEGNYLLLNRPPWDRLHRLYDTTALLELPESELRRRLGARWQGHGLTGAEIDFKLEQNDLPNGCIVMRESAPPDYRIMG